MRPSPVLGRLAVPFLLAPLAAAQDPVVTAVQPTSAEHPAAIAIDGANFDATSTVAFDGVPATVQAFTPTLLVVVPAAGAPGFADVTVTNAVGSTVAPGAGTLWPALAASENGLGGTLALALENGEPGAATYAWSLGLLGAPVAIDPGVHFGVLLNPGGAFGLLGAFAIPGSGEHAVGFPIGSAPSSLGLTIHLQAFATQGLPPHDASFSNAATVVIGGSLAPRGLLYPVDPMELVVGQPAAPNTPVVSGWVETWQVAPPLPSGLAFDPQGGTISGTPSGTSSGTYTVTASNPAGFDATTVEITASNPSLEIESATHGFGQLLPFRAFDPSAGTTVDVTSLDVLEAQLAAGATILPLTTWPTTAVLPNGAPGNHFLAIRFSEPLFVPSVLSSFSASHLTGAITVTAIDPATGASAQVPGRPFIDGYTYDASTALERWVEHDPDDLDGDGLFAEVLPVGGATPGLGFPGTESSLTASLVAELFGPDTFVFVFDADALLATHETAPQGVTIRVEISPDVRAQSLAYLGDYGAIATTVGPDVLAPRIATLGGAPFITPPDGSINVDPKGAVTLRFTEALAPASLGYPTFAPKVGGAVDLSYGGPSQPIAMPYTLGFYSPFDLSTVSAQPAEPFPSSGLALGSCADYGHVDVAVNAFFASDLAGLPLAQTTTIGYATVPGQGIVNAPVAPDAIYVGRGDSLSVVDLNGFGGGTGTQAFDPLCPVGPGQTDYPNNPNLWVQGAQLVPPLAPGTCTLDGGSDGVFSLTKDTSLDDRLLRNAIASIDDMALGHPLDRVFNTALPLGCSSGGNLCTHDALQVFEAVLAPTMTTLVPPNGPPPTVLAFSQGNPISWAPHPNPPPLVLPPSCASPAILGQEPTSILTPVINLLVPGTQPLGVPPACIAPSGLLALEQNSFFRGPAPAAPTLPQCFEFTFRQQLGQFLYAVDSTAGSLVVLNSNRMTVLARIDLPDPTRLAMSPNLDLLAVTNASAGVVSFVDVDPASATFHQVVKTTPVGAGPHGVAWDSGNEDVFVCNELSGTVSVISAHTLEVRKTLTGFLSQPFDVVTTPRQDGFGLKRGVYFAWILNRDGTLTLFESGPNGAGGIGYDDCVGVAPFTLAGAQTLQPDPFELRGAVWVAHTDPLDPATGLPTGVGGAGGPALTRVRLTAGVPLPVPIVPGSPPDLRDLGFAIDASLDSTVLTGAPTDLAFDDQRNLGSAPNLASPYGAGSALAYNGKSLVKTVPGTGTLPASAPRLLFAAVPSSTEGPGVVDVIDLAALTRFDVDAAMAGAQSIPAPGATVLMSYFRQ